MTKSRTQQTPPDVVDNEAFEWLVLLTSGEATAGDLQALKRWRAQNPVNDAAFVRAGKLWRCVGPAVETVARQGAPATPAERSWPRRIRVARRAVLGGALAAGAAYVLVRPPLRLWPSLAELTSDYCTGIGQQRRITTAGGVTLELNTDTSVDIDRTADPAERIELIAGEVTITTAANGSASGVAVVAADGRVTATDATFNVRYSGGVVCITCVAGTVQVARRAQSVTAQPRQQVSYTNRGLGEAVTVDPAGVTAWRQGVLAFHDVPLDEVIEEVNRYRRGRILVMDAGLGRRRVTARFKLDRLQDAVTLVREVFGARVTSLPGGILLLTS